MAALATVLMFIETPLPLFPPFLKLDISDLPAVICAFAIGPLWGVLVELIKNLVHMTSTQTALVGETANFIVGASFTLCAGIIYKKRHTKKGAVVGLAAGILSMALAGVVANYLILLPLYSPNLPEAEKASLVFYGITPFNLLKGVILSAITLFIYKPLSSILHR